MFLLAMALSSASLDIYVNPAARHDIMDGSIAHPLKNVHEAAARVRSIQQQNVEEDVNMNITVRSPRCWCGHCRPWFPAGHLQPCVYLAKRVRRQCRLMIATTCVT